MFPIGLTGNRDNKHLYFCFHASVSKEEVIAFGDNFNDIEM